MNQVKGKIYLVGLGPGDARHLTPAASAALAACDVVVGYRAYIEQIAEQSAPLLQGKETVAMELGQELERAVTAVDLASEGRAVAVVSSGDAGIYGMAGPVFRVLSQRGWDGEDPEVETVPGVSAMQAAAAILGSPLMQDFCAISLSDLLTPWEKIRVRLEAAALGDFVVALYNPRSQRRREHLRASWPTPFVRVWRPPPLGDFVVALYNPSQEPTSPGPEHLLRAREILLQHRDGATPVGIVADAFREGQRGPVLLFTDDGTPRLRHWPRLKRTVVAPKGRGRCARWWTTCTWPARRNR